MLGAGAVVNDGHKMHVLLRQILLHTLDTAPFETVRLMYYRNTVTCRGLFFSLFYFLDRDVYSQI